jgi:ankyrin repeat protein
MYTGIFSEYPREVLEALKYGADPNIQDEYGRTLLKIHRNNPYIIEMLLEYGADPNMQDKYGQTLLHIVSLYPCMKLSLEYGADPNIQDNYGNTPMHYIYHNVQNAKLLLEYGADLTIKNNDNKNPIEKMDDKEVKKFLEANKSSKSSKFLAYGRYYGHY